MYLQLELAVTSADELLRPGTDDKAPVREDCTVVFAKEVKLFSATKDVFDRPGVVEVKAEIDWFEVVLVVISAEVVVKAATDTVEFANGGIGAEVEVVGLVGPIRPLAVCASVKGSRLLRSRRWRKAYNVGDIVEVGGVCKRRRGSCERGNTYRHRV